MAENMTMADYVAADIKRRAEAQAEPTKPVEPAAKEAPSVDAEVTAEATTDAAVQEEAKPAEQGAEAESDTEDVLSNFTPKAKEQIQKRIGVLTARAKEAEEKAKAEAEEKAQLLTKLEQLSQQQAQPVPVPVILGDDPNDLAAKATTPAEIAKVEQSAREMLDLIEENEHLIARAIARDEETVTLSDGQVYKVDSIPKAKRQAKAHIERYVPARRQFLQQRQTAVEAAKGKFPALFKADSEEHLAFQSAIQQTPALRHVPNAELLYGYALRGLKAEKAEQEAAAKKAKVEPASAQPAKASSDTAATSAATRTSKTGSAATLRDLEAKLAAAKKEMERTGSMQAFTTITKLQRQIKNL